MAVVIYLVMDVIKSSGVFINTLQLSFWCIVCDLLGGGGTACQSVDMLDIEIVFDELI